MHLPQFAIEIENLRYTYPAAQESTLNGVSLSAPVGSITGIIGPSGAGKSTLCLAMAGVVPHMTGGKIGGSLRVMNHNLLQEELPDNWAGTVGVTLQDPESQLVASSVEENLVFGPENLGIDPIEIDRRVTWALEVVRMSSFRYARSQSLSGGQKQRVALASVLTMLPKILILDEPTSELDPVGKAEVFDVIQELRKIHAVTVVIVEHEIESLAQYADQLIVLNSGQVMLRGATRSVLAEVEEMTRAGVRVPQITELGYQLGLRCLPVLETEIQQILQTQEWNLNGFR